MSEETRFEIEQALIGSILQDPARVMSILERGMIRPDQFENAKMGKIYQACISMWRGKISIDAVTVKAEWSKVDKSADIGFLMKAFDSTPTAAHCEFYLKQFRDFALADAMKAVCKKAMVDIANAQGGMEPVYSSFAEAVKGIEAAAFRGNRFVDLEAVTVECERRWEHARIERHVKKNRGIVNGIPLPWTPLNGLFAGVEPGLHIIAARPSEGKTTIAVNYSEFWDEMNIPHLVVSIDMAGQQAFKRFGSTGARVSLTELDWGAQRKKINRTVDAMRGVIKRGNMHMTEVRDLDSIKSICAEAKYKFGIKLVLIDYVQIVTLNRREAASMKKNYLVGYIAEELKAMSHDLDIPVFGLCQLKRARDKTEAKMEPTLEDLKDSGELEQAAASVTMLHRDLDTEEIWRDAPERIKGLAFGHLHLAKRLRPVWALVVKNQQGATGRMPMVMYPNYFIFRPGDIEAKPAKEKDRGREIKLNYPLFETIRDNWRNLPEDELLDAAGFLGPRTYKWELANDTDSDSREPNDNEQHGNESSTASDTPEIEDDGDDLDFIDDAAR